MIPELQPERLQNLSQELQFAINTNNISSMEDHSQETRREIRNLPDEVQLVQVVFSLSNKPKPLPLLKLMPCLTNSLGC
jgi:predicted RNase H-like nuclease (RuvC/YqgF family)